MFDILSSILDINHPPCSVPRYIWCRPRCAAVAEAWKQGLNIHNKSSSVFQKNKGSKVWSKKTRPTWEERHGRVALLSQMLVHCHCVPYFSRIHSFTIHMKNWLLKCPFPPSHWASWAPAILDWSWTRHRGWRISFLLFLIPLDDIF